CCKAGKVWLVSGPRRPRSASSLSSLPHRPFARSPHRPFLLHLLPFPRLSSPSSLSSSPLRPFARSPHRPSPYPFPPLRVTPPSPRLRSSCRRESIYSSRLGEVFDNISLVYLPGPSTRAVDQKIAPEV